MITSLLLALLALLRPARVPEEPTPFYGTPSDAGAACWTPHVFQAVLGPRLPHRPDARVLRSWSYSRIEPTGRVLRAVDRSRTCSGPTGCWSAGGRR